MVEALWDLPLGVTGVRVSGRAPSDNCQAPTPPATH
jgi:hypothetical protein